VVHVRGVRPNNYIILAVIGILFFWPTGIIALMYALQVCCYKHYIYLDKVTLLSQGMWLK
jgi:hypothetical protein